MFYEYLNGEFEFILPTILLVLILVIVIALILVYKRMDKKEKLEKGTTKAKASVITIKDSAITLQWG